MLKIKLNSVFNNYKFYLWFVIFLSFITKLFNLNYNSPSSDESVYIAIGHSIISNWNWAIYNTASWVGGHTYFYPIITSLGYYYSGIVGSRLINIIFLSISVYFTYLITSKMLTRLFGGIFKKRVNLISLISVIVLAFSSSSIYISRLATYDMPSFTLLIIGLYYLVSSVDNKFDDHGKAVNFFLSAIFLSLSFAFKYITILFLPLILVVSYLFINKYYKKSLLHYWKFYFFTPIALLVSVVLLTQFNYLKVFITSQVSREQFNAFEVLVEFFKNTYFVLPYFIIGTVGLVSKKRWRMLIGQTISLSVIILFHVIFGRISALDKHSFLLIFIIAVMSSVGVYELYRKKLVKYLVIAYALCYVPYNLYLSQKYNFIWPNYKTAINYFEDNMTASSKLLSENGSSIILTTYKDLNQENVVTFDWFENEGLIGKDAYQKAVLDGYFKYIELETDSFSKPSGYAELNETVRDSLLGNYSVVLENNDYKVFKRDF